MTAESPKYSRQEISDEAKRKSTAEEIRTANKGVDKKKTPEGKKELSQTWIQKANLTPAQKQALCDELLVKDIENTTAEELQRRVIALQKHLGFPEKDCDGILWWKTLEKVDQIVENQHKLEDEEGGIQNNEDWYGFDRVANQENRMKERTERTEKLRTALEQWQTEWLTDINGENLMLDGVDPNGEKILKGTNENSDKYYNIDTGTYETAEQRSERIAKQDQETEDQKTKRLSSLKEAMNSDDRAKTENIVDGEDRLSVQVGEDGEKYLQRDSDGKVLNFETGEYETMEDRTNRLAKSKDPSTEEYKAKMREIGEEMKSNPDVYSDTETGKSTYTFNGEELSLEWEAPNQYITRTVNGKKQMWESESESWEDINETKYNLERIAAISNIDGKPLPENKWTKIDNAVYFRNWETLIAILGDWKMQQSVGWKWYELEDFSKLPADAQAAATNARLEWFQNKYWDWEDWEMFGTTKQFNDIPLADINRFDDLTSGNSSSRIEGKALMTMVNWLLQSKKSEAPKMWELTLSEYNKYNKNPDLFAQSRFLEATKKNQNIGFVDPQLYGINSGWYEYDRQGDMVVKRPKTWANIDTIMIAGKDGKFENQRSWLQRVQAEPGKEYILVWSENVRFQKDKNGDIYIYKKGEKDKPIEKYANGKWEKPTWTV